MVSLSNLFIQCGDQHVGLASISDLLSRSATMAAFFSRARLVHRAKLFIRRNYWKPLPEHKSYDRGYRKNRPDLVDNHILNVSEDVAEFEDFEYYDPLSPGYIEPTRVGRLKYPLERKTESIFLTRDPRIHNLLSYYAKPLVGLRDPWTYYPKKESIESDWNVIFPRKYAPAVSLFSRIAAMKESGNWKRLVPTADVNETRIELLWKDHDNLPVKSILNLPPTESITETSIVLASGMNKNKKKAEVQLRRD